MGCREQFWGMGINLEVPGVILGCRGQFWGAGAHFRVPGQEEDFGGGGVQAAVLSSLERCQCLGRWGGVGFWGAGAPTQHPDPHPDPPPSTTTMQGRGSTSTGTGNVAPTLRPPPPSPPPDPPAPPDPPRNPRTRRRSTRRRRLNRSAPMGATPATHPPHGVPKGFFWGGGLFLSTLGTSSPPGPPGIGALEGPQPPGVVIGGESTHGCCWTSGAPIGSY